jgi:hypothetical protein
MLIASRNQLFQLPHKNGMTGCLSGKEIVILHYC